MHEVQQTQMLTWLCLQSNNCECWQTCLPHLLALPGCCCQWLQVLTHTAPHTYTEVQIGPLKRLNEPASVDTHTIGSVLKGAIMEAHGVAHTQTWLSVHTCLRHLSVDPGT